MIFRNLKTFSQLKAALRTKYLAIRKEFIVQEGPLYYSSFKENLQLILSHLNCNR